MDKVCCLGIVGQQRGAGSGEEAAFERYVGARLYLEISLDLGGKVDGALRDHLLQYLCCVCVCERERERESAKERESERERELVCVRARVCVCVCVCVCV